MVGYWHNFVVCRSALLSVSLWRCALWLSGSVYMAEIKFIGPIGYVVHDPVVQLQLFGLTLHCGQFS